MTRRGVVAVAVVWSVWSWSASVGAESGTAVIRATADGSSVSGKATLTDTPQGLQVVVQVAHVAPGQHGWHIHRHVATQHVFNSLLGD